ncbi:MAG TPA: CcmD family protein [Puia sp.]|jgi:CcmD family protein
MHKKLFALLLLFLGTMGLAAQAQSDPQHVEMADQLRANGKIYVVVAVLIVILLGLFLYVIRLDRKITRLEKESPGRRNS